MSQHLGPRSTCFSEDLGPWSASALAGAGQKAAPKKEAKVAPKEATTSSWGPWSAHRPGTPQESRSQSRSQGVRDSEPLGPWSEASQKGQAARSQGVKASAEQKLGATSDQSTPPKKAQRVDLTQVCVMDIPNHVRGHAVPMSKTTERAKDPKAVKTRCSGNGRSVCVDHTTRQSLCKAREAGLDCTRGDGDNVNLIFNLAHFLS